MKIYLILLITILLTIDCSSFNAPEKQISASKNSQSAVVSNNSNSPEISRETNLLRETNSNPADKATAPQPHTETASEQAEKEDFSVSIAADPKRNAQNVLVTVGRETKWTIETPSFEEVNNFAVDEAKKNANGFEIKVEYGSRYKYEKTFYFVGKNIKFSLSQIRVRSFDGNNPEKWSDKTIKINPPVSLDKFKMEKYLSD